jgi:hypothetical protein
MDSVDSAEKAEASVAVAVAAVEQARVPEVEISINK